jgi:glycosyltransferase involved in cell wall biosynthesis
MYVMLRFSVVIPTLNRREMLLTAIQSIREQTWDDVQIIVVDGGSQDGTIEEILRQPNIQLIKAPGSGVYDALNIGLGHSSGDIIGLLNSDDEYETHIFPFVAKTFEALPELDAVCGSALLVDGDRIVTIFDNHDDKVLTSPRTALIGSCMPNARFFRRTAMEQIGLFSLDYRYIADRDWLLRWYESGLKTGAIPEVVYRYRRHVGSLTFNAERRHASAIREELLILARRWQRDPRASKETRRIARFLEGRSIAKLAIGALWDGEFDRAGRLFLTNEGALSLSPLLNVSRGVIDWIVERPGRFGRRKQPYS